VYQFSFAASFGDDLLRQVQAVTVRVELLRCTLGQYMTVSCSAAAAAAAAVQCTSYMLLLAWLVCSQCQSWYATHPNDWLKLPEPT
jgi:hypothetical protein